MAETIRIDKWLWHTRLVKTRSLAARLCETGSVEIGTAPATRPAHSVKVGDHVVLRHAGWSRTLEVVALGTRRGPAPEARLLYRECSPPERIEEAEWIPLVELTAD